MGQVPSKLTVSELQRKYSAQEKISMLTCYDYTSAKILNTTSVDTLLVGDSVAMVMHGHNTTINATLDMMVLHTSAVARGAPNKFIIGDLPFLSYRKGLSVAMQAVEALMQAGAEAVKLEGAKGNLDIVRHIVDSGVPVVGHLGLTPQSVHMLSGHKVQARQTAQIKLLLDEAQALQEAGVFMLVLECIPASVAKQVTQALSIPTIGIGAGPDTSGQVLVLPDMLGMSPDFSPKLLKKYGQGYELLHTAAERYAHEVSSGVFPSEAHCYQVHAPQQPEGEVYSA